MTRRGFLGASAAAASVAAAAQSGDKGDATKKLKVGLLGCGWYGNVDANDALKAGGVEIVAVCDVARDRLEKPAADYETKQGTRPKEYTDYREMIDQTEMDALIIATPTQWHALQFIAACEKGLDIYCEKPFSYDLREGQAMLAAHEKAGNIVQIGFQRRQGTAFNEAKRFIEEGHAGRIVQVDAQIHYGFGPKDATPQDPPATLDWNEWCGPAPLIPFSPNVYEGNWRQEKTTGHGHLVDWGIHHIDMIRYTLGLSMPKSISAAGGLIELTGKMTTPDTLTVHFDFEQCPVVWRHRLWGAAEFEPRLNNCILFYGEKATIYARDADWEVVPRKGQGERKLMKPEASPDSGLKHVEAFLDAVRTRKPASCLPLDAHLSTSTVNLAMIAYETGQTLTWDDQAQSIPGNPAAQALLKRDYRKPWAHPFTG